MAEQNTLLEQAVARLRDILQGDDGQAYKEAKKFLERYDAAPTLPRPELLALAENAGAVLTGKPDATEPIEIVFSVQAWRKFDAALASRADPVKQVARAALDWIDAVPSETVLPAMPGFDRDWAENVLEQAK